MNLIPGICTQCGSVLSVSENRNITNCPYCYAQFISEAAIQYFNNKYTLRKFSFQENDKDFEVVGGVLKKYHSSALDVIIPENVITIDKNVFSGTKIKSVFMYDNVIEILDCAFAECNNLKTITFSSNLEFIGAGAFAECNNLRTIAFSSNLKFIGVRAFASCESLINLVLPNSLEDMEDSAFDNCTNLETIDFPSSLLSSSIKRHWFGHWEYYGDDTSDLIITCEKLQDIYIDGHKLGKNDTRWEFFPDTNQGYKYRQQQYWMNCNRCKFCGGEFSGIFTLKCKKCGKIKKY